MSRRRSNRTRPVRVRLRESAAVLDRPAATIDLIEAAPPLTTGGKCRKYRACLIQGDRWGTRGYYPGSVLAADGPAAWPAGTHMHFDHPSMTEEADRPERSLRSLVGTIASTPEYQTDGPQGAGLYADISVYPSWLGRIDEMAGDIGLSIRASGTAEPGTRDGRSGLVITSIAPSPTNSVDYVTRAGAGGKLVALLESARTTPTQNRHSIPVAIREAGSIGAWFESRIHSEFTEEADDQYGWGQLSRAERIALSSAIGDALDAFVARLQADAPQLYQRDQWGDTPTHPAEPEPENGDAEAPVDMAMSETATATTTDVPAPPDEPTTTTGEEAPMSGSPTDPGQAERIAALETALAEAQRAAEEATTRLAEAEIERIRTANEATARATATRLLESSQIDARVRPAILPLIEAAAVAHVAALTTPVDPAALDAAVTAALGVEHARVTQLAEALGTGTPQGFGAPAQGVTATAPAASEVEQTRTALIESYKARGMSERAATLAATGRAI